MSNTKHFSSTDTETWPLPAVITGQSGFCVGFCVGVCVGFGVGFGVVLGVVVVLVAGLSIALFSDPVKICRTFYVFIWFMYLNT